MNKDYLQFCTERQAEILEAYLHNGSSSEKAGKALDISGRSVRSSIQRIKATAAKQGHSPEEDAKGIAAEGYRTKGKSINYDADGNIRQIWLKTDVDKEAQDKAWKKAIEGMCEGIKPIPPIAKPVVSNSQLLNLYTLTDYHIGALAYPRETGDDWNTDIAAQLAIDAMSDMINRSPSAEKGLFLWLGDDVHIDSLKAVTPNSGHVLDADTRYDKMVEVYISITVEVIKMLCAKHSEVILFVAEGNHNESGSVWLRKAMKYLFANQGNVSVDDTAFPYYAYQHGKTMLGFHHGHLKKIDSLPALFASEPRYRAMWGNSEKTYIHTGHYHHVEQVEKDGAIVERHPTLAGRDSYAARHGFISNRACKAITYHKDYGEYSRLVFYPEMVRVAA